MAESAGEKTEQPTPRRRKEARERGQVAKTPELSAWVAVLATTVLLQTMIKRGARALNDVLESMGEAIKHPEPAIAIRFAADSMWKAVGILAPFLLGMMLVAFVTGVAQVGFRPTAKKLKPDFSRLNPFKGLKRMVSMQSLWEVLKGVAKTGILVVVALPIFTGMVSSIMSGEAGTSMWSIASLTASSTLTMLRNVAAAGLAVAAADYTYQKLRVNKQLKMTRQELREELKQQEGHPEMKRAIRSRAIAISRNQMIRSVSAADVITVNPTHYAVALKYDAAKGAPQVLAKGAGVIAAAIRAEGEAHGVPIVHEPVLTRTLYRSCEVGHLIPVELYEAVAHLLAFVFGLRAKGRARGYHELPKPALL
jgi:flagellar biosynthetic protein FlhB